MARGLRVVLVLAAVLGIAACQPTQSGEPPTSFGPPPSPTSPGDSTPVVLDSSLVAVLPESIDGFPVTESVDEAALALTDPALPRIATALDAGVAVDTAGANLVYAIVVKLRPEAFTADTYRQWRDSYDEGACAGAGGVLGRAEATIDERTVFVTSCATGLHTYHLWLEDEDLLISAPSIGDGRFGEKLMAGLRVPG